MCDSRGGEYLAALAGVIDELAAAGVVHRVVFLDRRRGGAGQPLQGDPPPPPARAARQRRRRHPRRAASCSRRCASARTSCIDTSGLSAAALRRKVADELLEPGDAGQARGHVHVVRPQARPAARRRPRVRRPLPAEPALRRRPAPADRVRPADRRLRRPRRPAGGVLRRTCCRCSSTCCPQYVAEGKAHLMVAIGCTGGRHRSVAIAEHLARSVPRPRRSTSSRSRTATSTALPIKR